MERTINTKFYHFNQNNSGGYLVNDDKHGVCSDVIIEAKDNGEAWNKLQEIGSYVYGMFDYCSCCGERWSSPWDDDGKEEPMIYDKPIDQFESSWYHKKCFVHYYDGTVKEFIFNEKKE